MNSACQSSCGREGRCGAASPQQQSSLAGKLLDTALGGGAGLSHRRLWSCSVPFSQHDTRKLTRTSTRTHTCAHTHPHTHTHTQVHTHTTISSIIAAPLTTGSMHSHPCSSWEERERNKERERERARERERDGDERKKKGVREREQEEKAREREKDGCMVVLVF